MSRMKIGWGRRDVSTTEKVNIPGQMYMRISEGVLDPLMITALCIDGGQGNDTVIFCSCDQGNFNNNMVPRALERLTQRRPDIPAESVILNCTHTHTCTDGRPVPEYSPDGIKIYPPEKYMDFYFDKFVEAVAEAWDSRSEGGVAYGYGYAVVAHSRRSVYFEDMSLIKNNPVSPNGHSVMYGNTREPLFSHYEAGADHFVNLMFTVDANDRLTGIVVNIPCPSQTSEAFKKLSADYWHDIREGVKKTFGDHVYVLPQCGAAGDLSPRVLHYKEAQKRRMALKYGLDYDLSEGNRSIDKAMAERYDIAERVLDAIREVYGWAIKDIHHEAAVKLQKIEAMLSARKITPEERDWAAENIERMKQNIPGEGCATAEEIRKAVTQYNSIKDRNMAILQKYDRQGEDPKHPTTVYAVQIGEVAFATNQFELYMDYMHRIQARSPFIQTFIVQLAAPEYGGYLATERGVAGKGYSASLFDNRVSAKGGQELVELTLDALERLHQTEPDA